MSKKYKHDMHGKTRYNI